MNPSTVYDIMSSRRKGAGAATLRGLLYSASVPYAGLMRLRRWMYQTGLLKRTRVDIPVICVGNITTGGTGKTPMVAWIVERFKERGVKAAVITRGYKAGEGLSDEALLLKNLTGAEVIVNPDRIAAAAQAAAGGAQVIIMDDGFQHMRLARDLDIVLIDATNPFGYQFCLPRGMLREPASALAQADAIIITRSDLVPAEQLEQLSRSLKLLSPTASVHLAVHEPFAAIDENGRHLPPQSLAGKKVLAFCGLGNPAAFFDTLKSFGAEIVHAESLADHVVYTRRIISRLQKLAGSTAAQLMITTEKDFVKLVKLVKPVDPVNLSGEPVISQMLPSMGEYKIWQLAVRIKITHHRNKFVETLFGVRS